MADWEAGAGKGFYTTMTPQYEAAQLHVLASLVQGGHVFRGEKPVHWSPAAQSALAEAELEYIEDHESTAIHFAFKIPQDAQMHTNGVSALLQQLHQAEGGQLLAGHPIGQAAFAAWTTTPWTLPANRALCVHPVARYTMIAVKSSAFTAVQALVVAADLAEAVVAEMSASAAKHVEGGSAELLWQAAAPVMGKDLVGMQTEHPLSAWSDFEFPRMRSVVINGDHVTMDAGTGVVHTAPGHGHDDFDAAVAWNATAPAHLQVEVVCPVGPDGSFDQRAGSELAGRNIHASVPDICSMLEKHGLLLASAKYKHRYPYDWRTKAPVIIRVTPQWFADLSKLQATADAALQVEEDTAHVPGAANHHAINMVPPQGRNRLRAAVDGRARWCISRQRTWGVPIPAWIDGSTGEALPLTPEAVAHFAEVVAQHPRGTDAWWEMGPHELLPAHVLEELGPARVAALEKSSDTLDVWFDSGCSWAAGWVDGEAPPDVADAYLEGSDQHRGWFQSSLLTSVAARGTAPYRNLITHGFVMDADGRKMSKSLGNVVAPGDIINGVKGGSKSASNVKGQKGKQKRKAGKGGSAHGFTTPYGVDVARLWVGSTDYTRDVSLSPTTVGKCGDAVRKLRNTARFLLANIEGFVPPAAVAAASPSMTPLDRASLSAADKQRGFADASPGVLQDAIRAAWQAPSWHEALPACTPFEQFALARVSSLRDRCSDALEGFSTARHHSDLMSFATQDLSSGYLDFVKDVLYCDPLHSPRRLAAQAGCWEALKALTVATAPVTPFMAEEVFLHANSRIFGTASTPEELHAGTAADPGITVFETPWWNTAADAASERSLKAMWGAGRSAADVDAQWTHILAARGIVLSALERARGGGDMGASLEAAVTLFVTEGSGTARALLELQGAGCLEDVLGVSQASVVELPVPKLQAAIQQAAPLSRSWNTGPQSAYFRISVPGSVMEAVPLSGLQQYLEWMSPAHGMVAEGGSGGVPLLAVAAPADGNKCARCWKVRPEVQREFSSLKDVDVATDSPHEHLCARCSGVMGAVLR